MPHVSLHSDPYTLLVMNVLRAGDRVEHNWGSPKPYGLIVAEGAVVVNGDTVEPVGLVEIPVLQGVTLHALEDAQVLHVLAAVPGALGGVFDARQVAAFCSRDHFGQRAATFSCGWPDPQEIVIGVPEIRELANETLERWSVDAIRRLGRY